MMGHRAPRLTDLAFEGRNKSYGAYDLHKKYYRYLMISFFLGVVIFLLLVLVPFFYYMFEPLPPADADLMYAIEYYGMSMPPEEDLSRLAEAFARPQEQVERAPVVTDSVIPDEKKKEEEPAVEPAETNNPNEDSLAVKGGSGLGVGTGEDTGPVSGFDVYPRFPGGDDARLYYLRKNIRYPEEALKKQIQGVVMVVFIVEPDGSLSKVDVLQRLGGGCDEEAIRVARTMPRWDPGKRNGKPVRVMVRMPIVFRIPGKPAK